MNIELNKVGTAGPELPRKHLLEATEEAGVYILRIDNSSMEAFLSCERSAAYRLVYGRSTYPTAALAYGSALHKALDVLYMSLADGKAANLAGMLEAGVAELHKDPSLNLGWRNEGQLTATLQKYLKEYSNENFEIISVASKHGGVEVPAVELPFQLHLGEVNINSSFQQGAFHLVSEAESEEPFYVKKIIVIWTGRIDLIGAIGESLWVVDHKTTSMAGTSYFESFSIAAQFVGYCVATSQLTDRRVTGALANVIIAREPTKTGRSIEFRRMTYSYSDELRDEWKRDTLAHVQSFLLRLAQNYFPKRTFHCVNKFGTCPYLPVCTQPEAHKANVLYSGLYVPYTWNPLI
jgi:hypothetical protein